LVDALFRYRGEQQPSLLSLGCAVTKRTSDVIEKGMELDHRRRYQDFKQLLDDIDIQSAAPKPARTSPADWSSAPAQQPAPNQAPVPGPQPIPRRVPARANSQPAISRVPAPPPAPSFVTAPVENRAAPFQTPAALGASESIPTVSTLIPGRTPVRNTIGRNDILRIGRSRKSNHMVLDHDGNISRDHCFVRFDAGRNMFYLSDISANGTYFEDGRRLEKNKEYAVPPGTRFYLVSKSNMLAVGIEHA
ncbi:MAG: FHA domain-containing protein, partial [Clostridiales Family XIII bacterium]|jgi:hypothetical protein|nr:FHA domain-containing protein [Clostridiales Family XIII bacterium]